MGGAKKNALGGFRDCGPSKSEGGQWSVMVGAGKGKCNKGYHKGMQASFTILGVNTTTSVLACSVHPKGLVFRQAFARTANARIKTREKAQSATTKTPTQPTISVMATGIVLVLQRWICAKKEKLS